MNVLRDLFRKIQSMKLLSGLQHWEEVLLIFFEYTASIKQDLEVHNGPSEQRTKSLVLRKQQESIRMQEERRDRSMALYFAMGSLD